MNENAARAVAAGVLLCPAATLGASLVFGESWLWLTVPLAAGFHSAGVLVRLGLISEAIGEACADLSTVRRLAATQNG